MPPDDRSPPTEDAARVRESGYHGGRRLPTMTSLVRKILFFVSITLFCFAAGCDRFTGSCIHTYSCVEYYGLNKHERRATEVLCNTFGSTWSTEECSRDNVVGFCERDADGNNTELKLYYSGTVDEARNDCNSDGGEFTTDDPAG